MIKFILPAALASAVVASAASISVDPTATKQSVVGFGGGAAYAQSWVYSLGSAAKKDFFDTAFTGLNLSLLRVANWQNKDAADGKTAQELRDEDPAVLASFVKEAKKRQPALKIEMSSWGAPGELKKSGSVNGNASSKENNTLKASTSDKYGKYVYTDFANWWKQSLEAYSAMGVNIDYISLQNEPDMNAAYEATLFEPTETETYAGYAQALNAMRDIVGSMAKAPKILGPEPLGIGYDNFQKYAKALDTTKLDGYDYHLYHAGDDNNDADVNYLHPENYEKPMSAIASKYGSDNKPIIMTEFCNMLGEEREVDMVGLAHIMQIGFTQGKLNGYIAWELFWYEGRGQLIGVCTNGWGSCSADKITINPEYHGMRHFSKFVNPGSRVIAATSDDSDIKTVAFRSIACDSVAVIAINTSNTAKTLNAPAVTGYAPISAVQSVENGVKSSSITTSVSYSLPARSITTIVYKNDGTTTLSCEDRPTVDPTQGNDGPAEIVIVDYANETTAGKWSSDITATPNDITLETTPLAGVSKYVKVPLAGCAQDDCGYQHAIFTLPAAAVANDALAKCSELVITMQGIGGEASVNIGGAGGSEWVNYKYGNSAPEGAWDEVSIPLENEGDMGSNQLTFNSDNAGIYIAKIVATGCGTASIHSGMRFTTSDSHMEAKLFDLNGNLIWSGLKGQALNAAGNIRLDVRQGAYILKTKAGAVKAIKK